MTAGRFVACFVTGVALLQAAWIAILPAYRGIDEIDHAYWAAAVAHGQWLPGPYAEHGRGRLVEVPTDIVRAAHRQCEYLEYYLPENCEPVGDEEAGRVEVASGAAEYNPAYYWVVGQPSRILEGEAADFAMRAVAALLCIVPLGLAAWCLTIAVRSARWRVAGMLLALSPVAIYTTVIPAPNGLEIAAATLLWSALLALGRAEERLGGRAEVGVIAAMALAMVLLSGLRALGPGFAVAIIVVMLLLRPRIIEILVRRRWAPVLLAAAFALGLVGRYAWLASIAPSTVVNPSDNGRWSGSAPVLWIFQMIAAFPFRNQRAPLFVYPLFLILLGALLFAAIRRSRTRERFAVALLVVGILTAPIVLTALTYDSRGMIWQGRYCLPVAVGLPLICAAILDRTNAPDRLVAAVGVLALGIINVACLANVDQLQDAWWSASRTGAHGASAAVYLAAVAAATVCFMWATRERSSSDPGLTVDPAGREPESGRRQESQGVSNG